MSAAAKAREVDFLSPAQLRMLVEISAHWRVHGFSPSIRGLRDALAIGSTNAVNDTLRILERKGLIRREPMVARSIRLTPRGVEVFG